LTTYGGCSQLALAMSIAFAAIHPDSRPENFYHQDSDLRGQTIMLNLAYADCNAWVDNASKSFFLNGKLTEDQEGSPDLDQLVTSKKFKKSLADNVSVSHYDDDGDILSNDPQIENQKLLKARGNKLFLYSTTTAMYIERPKV
jgi:hypothetical protein